MKKDIKDYLHLYLGQEVQFVHLNDKPDVYNTKRLTAFDLHLSNVKNTELTFKPLLRPLSDMADDEKKHCCYYLRDAESMIQIKTVIGNETIIPKLFLYLLKQGFDLFGLIEDGLAIDKTKMK